ncbi:alpha/beta hydrolase [Planctobacterium marinum]|uniref:Ferri-bacillibactin esterase BesA n=1 Tax=Planctobacterium marinum TaxID=1631968 RepID=A0AA48HYT0_9ALTE|nr:ferri-bacillibactin esterase BesA [Planctobacterium marinum]
MTIRSTLLLFVLLSCLISTGKAQTLDSRYLQSLANTDTFEVKNQKQNYYIYVKGPAQQEPDKRYPVIYLLDGGITFPMLSAHAHLLQALEELPELIIVGISYGTDDWRQGNARSHDFTLPSENENRKHWGGATEFARFLTQKLIPLIAQKYPTDEAKRLLFGNSLGGQFGLYLATYRPELFYGIIANNPAIHTNTERFLKLPESLSFKGRVKLFVGAAEHDAARFTAPRKIWQSYWHENSHPNWQLHIQPMPGHSHVSSIPDAFRQGVAWILSTES